jgi:UDP-N-acetyl-D-galactosamine dehydrogenase
VGGHCIGVDPYYLTHKAEMLGYHPQVILAGRRINDGMAAYVAQQTVKKIIQEGGVVKGSRVIVLGLTFKENCPDLRNSKVTDLVAELRDFGCDVFVHDPLAESREARHEYGIQLTEWNELPTGADAIVAAVSHRAYLDAPLSDILLLLKPGGVFIDVKSAYDAAAIKAAGATGWRL